MAERYEVVIDFAKYPVGTRIVLRNLQHENNINFPNTDKVMAFDVTATPSTPRTTRSRPCSTRPTR